MDTTTTTTTTAATSATTGTHQNDRLAHMDNSSIILGHEDASGGLAQAEDLHDLKVIEKQYEIIDRILRLQTDLIDKNSECERLKIKLDESSVTAQALRQELNECKLTIFQNNEDAKKVHEVVHKNKTLEEDYVKLMSDFLILSERHEQDRQSIYDRYMAKTNAINNYESLMSRDAIKQELDQCRAELNLKLADVSLLSAKLRNLEEDVNVKEKCITELKKSLDDAKVTHKHEITVLEDYIKCLRNTITSYEKTLATYIDEEKPDDVNTAPAVADTTAAHSET